MNVHKKHYLERVDCAAGGDEALDFAVAAWGDGVRMDVEGVETMPGGDELIFGDELGIGMILEDLTIGCEFAGICHGKSGHANADGFFLFCFPLELVACEVVFDIFITVRGGQEGLEELVFGHVIENHVGRDVVEESLRELNEVFCTDIARK